MSTAGQKYFQTLLQICNTNVNFFVLFLSTLSLLPYRLARNHIVVLLRMTSEPDTLSGSGDCTFNDSLDRGVSMLCALEAS